MILWVDDDIETSLRPFLDEIEEAGYKVVRARTPDEMWKQLADHGGEICGIIMDIMLPTGDNIEPGDAEMGVTTGLVLLKKLRDKDKISPYYEMPLLIFTILRNQKVYDWAKANRVELLRKQETYPEELAEKVKTSFGLGR